MTKTYIVTVSSKYPAWNDRPEQHEVTARNAKDAIAQLRTRARKEDWSDNGGSTSFLYHATAA